MWGFDDFIAVKLLIAAAANTKPLTDLTLDKALQYDTVLLDTVCILQRQVISSCFLACIEDIGNMRSTVVRQSTKLNVSSLSFLFILFYNSVMLLYCL